MLFLDDLHFADTATVALLRVLLADIEHSHLLIVGSYRDDDTSTGWPLRLELTELRSKSSAVQIIELLPLTLDDVYALLSELLSCTPERVAQLALVLYEKTHGNPFFINQFLVMLHHEGLLRFDFAQESWQWNLAEIQNRQVTDNVVTFTLGKIRLLSESTQRILQLAACIGNQFDLETLRLLDSTSPQEIAAAIWDAQHEGLCIPVESTVPTPEDALTAASRELDRAISFRFLHDRVQVARRVLTGGRVLFDQRAVGQRIHRFPKRSRGWDLVGVFAQRCRPCHSRHPTDPQWPLAPNGIMFDSPEQIRVYSERIRVRAVQTRTMPLANKTGMTDAERELLERWLSAGSPLD